MDDIRVYNRALSAQEIRTLANTSVHVHTVVVQQNAAVAPASAAVDFVCSAPTPLPPTAPALTVGGSLAIQNLTVSGDVQACSSLTVNSPCSVTGNVTYGTTLADASNYLTLTYQGKSGAAVQKSGTVPTINYANVAAQSAATYASGSNQTFQYNSLTHGVAVFVVNGDCTDPVIDTSITSGTLLITGNLYITKNTTWGSAGFPAYVLVEGDVVQTGTLNLTGAIYAGGNWTHTDASINGDICIGGSVIDNTAAGSTFVVGPIPWFDPRGAAPPIPQSLFYVGYQGAHP